MQWECHIPLFILTPYYPFDRENIIKFLRTAAVPKTVINLHHFQNQTTVSKRWEILYNVRD
jgi:hypothetical protein